MNTGAWEGKYMPSSFGLRLSVQLFGESHGKAVGVVMEGLPAGEAVDVEQLRAFLTRRQGGGAAYRTGRREADMPEILSGVYQGRTNGAPLCVVFENGDARPADYMEHTDMPRPAHADYPAWKKFAGAHDPRGGGHFSGRLTAPLCAAGGICMQVLARRGIAVGAHILSIERERDEAFDPVAVDEALLEALKAKPLPVISETAGARMEDAMTAAARELDSVGGVIECAAVGLTVALGAPLFYGVENHIAAAVFAIGGVRGIEFGAGFEAAGMRGSVHNDPFCVREGQVRTETNRHGGVLGGLTSGMPLLFRVAVKPTPSIGSAQRTVDLGRMRETAVTITGRHDACIVPRAVPCVEAAAAIAILDLLVFEKGV